MARILRGEVSWADLNPVRGKKQAGLRPVLIISQDIFNQKSETVMNYRVSDQYLASDILLLFSPLSSRFLPDRLLGGSGEILYAQKHILSRVF